MEDKKTIKGDRAEHGRTLIGSREEVTSTSSKEMPAQSRPKKTN